MRVRVIIIALIEKKIPEKCHHSQELFALEKREKALADQGKFEEAHKAKMEVGIREKEEQEKWLQEREKIIEKKLTVSGFLL